MQASDAADLHRRDNDVTRHRAPIADLTRVITLRSIIFGSIDELADPFDDSAQPAEDFGNFTAPVVLSARSYSKRATVESPQTRPPSSSDEKTAAQEIAWS